MQTLNEINPVEQNNFYNTEKRVNNNVSSGKGNSPEKKFFIGGISATVWKNEGTNKDGETIFFKTITFEKNYKDKQGQWKGTNTLRSNDIPKASLVLNKAYEYMMMSAN